MTQHQRIGREKAGDSRKDRPTRAKRVPPGAPGTAPAGRLDEDSARLAAARTEQERAEVTLGLQQAYGNAYVQRLIQAKLTVSQPGDVYEQEADRVAADVTRGASEQAQRMTPEEEELLQGKPADSGGLQIPEDTEERIEDARSGGAPLGEAERAQIEPRLGADFAGVRVHTDAAADQLARDLSAEAFTTGQDVFFRSGAYEPGTAAGNGLLVHELTHVVQQQAAPAVQRDVVPGADEDELLAEMEEMGAEEEAAGPAPAAPAAEAAPAPAGPNAAEQQVTSAPTSAPPASPAPAPAGPNAAEQQVTSAPTAPPAPATTQETAGPNTAESVTASAPTAATATESATAAAPEATGTEAARLEAMRGMWDVAVVGAIRDAYNALAQARPNAGTALERLSSTRPVIDAVKDAYRDRNPSAYMTVSAFYQYLARRSGELRPHTEYATVSLDDIREGINPDGAAMRQWLSEVSAAL